MPIRVTLSCILDDDLWGADECYRINGEFGIKELIREDISAFVEECDIRVEKV